MPGVLKYLSAADIPPGGKNNYMPSGEYVEEVVFKIYYTTFTFRLDL